jgi:hypothetical protein
MFLTLNPHVPSLEAAFVALEILTALIYVHSKKLVMISYQPVLSISDFMLNPDCCTCCLSDWTHVSVVCSRVLLF